MSGATGQVGKGLLSFGWNPDGSFYGFQLGTNPGLSYSVTYSLSVHSESVVRAAESTGLGSMMMFR